MRLLTSSVGRLELRVGERAGGVHALALHDQAEGVAVLAEDHDLALEVGGPQVVDGLEVTTDLGLVVGDAGEPALPGQRVLPARVERHVLELVQQVGRVRHPDQLQRLAELLADHPVGHPVGEDEDVAVDVLAGPQLRGDLVEVGVVVVDVLGVGHRRCRSSS